MDSSKQRYVQSYQPQSTQHFQPINATNLDESLRNGAKDGDYSNVIDSLSKGANINSQSSTALMFASLNGHKKIVEYLVSKGADLHIKNDEGTALMCASFNGHKDIVEYLVSKGADLNIKNQLGTALMWASFNGHKDVVKYLVSKGADLHIRNNEGKRAIDIAIEKHNSEIKNILEQAMNMEEGKKIEEKQKKLKVDKEFPKSIPPFQPEEDLKSEKIASSSLSIRNNASKWNVDEVIKWLERNEFQLIVPIFKENHIDGEVLLELTEEKLETKLGIKALGIREKLYKKILQLKELTLSQSPNNNTSNNLVKVSPSEVEITNIKIGEGGFGDVYKAIYSGKEIVVKQLKNRTNENSFFEEAELALKVPHPHIIQCYGYTEKNGFLYLLFEYAKLGSLNKYLQQNKSPFNELLDLSIQLTSAIVFLHSRDIIHRDLAADNVLVSEGPMIKLSDFGLSRFSRRYAITGVRGRALFSAPEVLRDLNCYASPASDIYSLGIVLWQIFSYGIKPKNEAENLNKPADCTPELFSIMKDCWKESTSERPDAKTLLDKLKQIQQTTKK